MRRLLVAPLLLLALTGVALGATEEGEAGARSDDVPTRAGFTWEMGPRYGIDRDGDGRIEIENSYEYVNGRRTRCDADCPQQRFKVALEAFPSAASYGLDPSRVRYEWRISGPAGSATHMAASPTLHVRLPEGIHDIDLRVKVRVLWGSITLRHRSTIDVNDLLVVALGDSYASGEGSPEIRVDGSREALWADASDPAVEEMHALAHRSTVGWPAQVAAALEVADPRSSVTFVDLAATSARVGSGILGPQSFLGLPAQMDQLEEIIGTRSIDVLLLQIGGNDIGFSNVITELVDADPLLDPICYETMLDNIGRSVADGRWDRDASLDYDPPFGLSCAPSGGSTPSRAGLDGLSDEYRRLAGRLRTLDVGQVLIVEYPDPSGSDVDGGICEEIVGDVTAPFGFHEVDEDEQSWGRTHVLQPLNREVAAAANEHGWVLVDGIAAEFMEGHGYCAAWPDYGYPADVAGGSPQGRDRLDHPDGWYRRPSIGDGMPILPAEPVSWYRTAGQSAVLQGPTPRFLTSGTLHPNELGHAAIARAVLTVIATD
jgi:lysophospholipase L1-like esterase